MKTRVLLLENISIGNLVLDHRGNTITLPYISTKYKKCFLTPKLIHAEVGIPHSSRSRSVFFTETHIPTTPATAIGRTNLTLNYT
jgi:hypothetical protein